MFEMFQLKLTLKPVILLVSKPGQTVFVISQLSVLVILISFVVVVDFNQNGFVSKINTKMFFFATISNPPVSIDFRMPFSMVLFLGGGFMYKHKFSEHFNY